MLAGVLEVLLESCFELTFTPLNAEVNCLLLRASLNMAKEG